MFLGPQPVYQTVSPSYAHPHAPSPEALASKHPMHPQPPPLKDRCFAQLSDTIPQNLKKNNKGKGNKGNHGNQGKQPSEP